MIFTRTNKKILIEIYWTTRPAHDVMGTSAEAPLNALMSETYRRPSGDLYLNGYISVKLLYNTLVRKYNQPLVRKK